MLKIIYKKIYYMILDKTKLILDKVKCYFTLDKSEERHMGIKIDDFLKNTSLPKKYFDENFDISDKYMEEADFFLKTLRLIDGNEFESDKQDKIKKTIQSIIGLVEGNFEDITSIFKQHEAADPKGAQEKLDDVMEKLNNDLFIATIDDWVKLSSDKEAVYTHMRITPRRKFYRVRGVEYESPHISNNPNELFHIPMNKKALSNNERFSIAGFPSLYLSSMLPLAWQECGYPARYYFSEFQYEKLCGNMKRELDKELKFLALYSPEEIFDWGIAEKYNNFDLWLEVVSRYIKQYPLILACAFVNHSGSVSYKQEYIVPQMLMQWVQRNCDKVQGISYFTCADINMILGKWCAYNVVIPAQPPYDDEKYSIKLKEDFCWSKPQYYQVPIVDDIANKRDRQKLYVFIGKIQEVLSNSHMPALYKDYLHDAFEMCTCLYNVLLRGKTMDMQLLVHTMDLLNRYYRKIVKINIDEIIAGINVNKLTQIEIFELEQSSKKLRELVDELTKYDKMDGGIYSIIDKYSHLLWNDSNCSSITVLYLEKDNIDDAILWLHNNNLLHFRRAVAPDDTTINYLKDICKEVGISVDDLWGSHVENDNWMKEHINEIKTPIFVRENTISMYLSNGRKRYDYLHIGFDKNELIKII